jgi:2-dehydro-3-deoxygluconokinase
VLLHLSNQADIVFVGLDEADRLWGRCPNPDSVRAMLPTTPLLVVKDGPRGATAYAGQQSLFVPAPTLAVVEVVGSGDAFAAGFLTGLLRGATLETALRLGHLTAASALLVTDDHGPLLHPDVIEPLLAATTDEWAAARITCVPECARSPHPTAPW